MELLTNSARTEYQSCPKKFYFRHELGYAAIRESEAMAFGTAFHKLLEAHFNGTPEVMPMIFDSIPDPFKRVAAEKLYEGYFAKYGEERAITEQEYVIPLINPKTMSASKTFELAGKIDGIRGGAIIEHKTTSESIDNPSADYWLKLAIDSQISGYFLAAEKLGHKPEKIIYDVIKKPTIKPGKATPEEDRKYKKDGTLYANQRATDETPEEYGQRLQEDIIENPGKYFQRREIARLESDLAEYMADMWSVAKLIMESRNENYWPKRTSQCFTYGRCAYYEVCAKIASIDDESLYRQEKVNSELSSESF